MIDQYSIKTPNLTKSNDSKTVFQGVTPKRIIGHKID